MYTSQSHWSRRAHYLETVCQLETDRSLNKLTRKQQQPIQELNYGRTETDNAEAAFQAAEQRRRGARIAHWRAKFQEQRAAKATEAAVAILVSTTAAHYNTANET